MILQNDVVDETNQPEEKDKDEEKYGIDHPHEGLADLVCNSSHLFLGPDLTFVGVLDERLPVGLHEDVHEGFEEADDQPPVHHLDVSRRGEVGAHTIVLIII